MELKMEFKIDDKTFGSGTIIVENGKVITSVVEDEFYDTLRKNEKSWLAQAEMEERDAIADHLTDEQEELLKEEHAKDYHGTDDDMPDSYDDWLGSLDLADYRRILATTLKTQNNE